MDFSEIITTEEELRAVLGHPLQRNIDKVVTALDEHCRAFISKSPFVLIASSNSGGQVDVSPKGDPPGFVQVLDDSTLAIPDRPGNRRGDTFSNILQNNKVGLIFLIPGKGETLRIGGSAIIVRDRWLRERMAVQGKTPDFAIVVTVEKAFMHCAKCIFRAKFWESEQWPDQEGLAPLARVLIDHAKAPLDENEFQDVIEQVYRENLY